MKNIIPLLLCIALTSCSTSPTGRRQMTFLPESQMSSMGAQSFEEMKKKTSVEHDTRINQYVKCIAQPIADEAKNDTGISDWEIVVFKDETANAFALPGGKIGVHTGILNVAKTPDQLAAVLGHEVGHVIAKHGNERVSQGFIAQAGLSVADALSSSSPNHGLLMGALGVGAQFGVLLPFSRTQENEADRIGEDLMARAGFDPRQSVELWKNMAAAGGKGPPQFLSTHPSSDTRIQKLSEHMNESIHLYNQAKAAGRNPRCSR